MLNLCDCGALLLWRNTIGGACTQSGNAAKKIRQFPAFLAIACDFRSGFIRVVLTVGRQLPVFPHKQTFSGSVGMSQTCQQATSRAKEARLGGVTLSTYHC